MITIALLGAVGTMALVSVRSSGSLLSSSSQDAAREDGVMLALVSVQSNSSGTYAWVYNYGWVQGKLSGAYLDGGSVAWSSSCAGVLAPQAMCAIAVPAGGEGQVSLVVGSKSLDFSV